MNAIRALSCTSLALALMGSAAVLISTSAQARNERSSYLDSGQYRPTGAPMLAIVGLNEQRITIYDANGKILQSPVSSGSTGYETPAGIYSIVQKKEMHNSNLYDDASMPFMQRITWTGIALHAGDLPGYPASHGCVRMPMSFARQIFDLTDMGMRVVVVREDMTPAEIEQPALFGRGARRPQNVSRHLDMLKSTAAAKSEDAEIATRREREAANIATRRSNEANQATRALRAAEANQAKADAAVKDAERAVEAAATGTPEAIASAETAKAKAVARLADADAALKTAQEQARAKADAATQAEADASAAALAKEAAAEAAQHANWRTSPVSVFISRKAQRLYIRRGNYPIYEAPVTIAEPAKQLGTFVFTALDYAGSSDMRWNVVSMYKNPTDIEPVPASQGSKRGAPRNVAATPTDVRFAKAALDRITVPDEVKALISDELLPGASLIISDEGASIETGKDTDFVIIMSGEPQGGIKIRQKQPMQPRPWGDSPWGGGGGSPFGGGKSWGFW